MKNEKSNSNKKSKSIGELVGASRSAPLKSRPKKDPEDKKFTG